MARSPQHRTYPREGSAVSNPLVKEPAPPGTPIYCWRFLSPWGWCGGDKTDRWETCKATILSAMKFSQYPCELLQDVIR